MYQCGRLSKLELLMIVVGVEIEAACKEKRYYILHQTNPRDQVTKGEGRKREPKGHKAFHT